MPQQRSPGGPKTPTWPTKVPVADSGCNDFKFSPKSSSFEESFMMLATQEYGTSPPKCCFVGCSDNESLDGDNTRDQSTIKVTCSKENCGGAGWMHTECYKLFEESTDKITSNGKYGKGGRCWNEKQKPQKSIGGRKGSSWECSMCCKNNFPETMATTAPMKFSGKKTKAKKQGSCGSTGSSCSASSSSSSSSSSSAARLSASFQHQLSLDGTSRNNPGGHARSRTLSLCSSGSSPPECSDDMAGQARFDFFGDPLQAAVGNIFGRRFTLDAFSCLPQHQLNPYQIKVEDEGPHGNDEIRSFILTTLSAQHVTRVPCCTCGLKMIVFDKYPLIDGAFFLSPLSYGKIDNTPVVDRASKKLYLNAICVECLSADLSSNISIRSKCLRCSFCERPWSGCRFLMGSMYSYDIFSAVPCCQARLLCNSCGLPVITFDGVGPPNASPTNGSRCFPGFPNGVMFGSNYVGFSKTNGIPPNGFLGSNGCFGGFGGNSALKFFSDYSKRITCPHCNVPDHHFVKPLSQVFYTRSIY